MLAKGQSQLYFAGKDFDSNKVPGVSRLEAKWRIMKLLSEIVGHQNIINLLRKIVITGRVAHAYLFLGPAGVGKNTVARAFARALLCLQPRQGDACGRCRPCRQAEEGNHPDLIFVRPTPNPIKIDQVRELQGRVALTPYQGYHQICLIERSETMTGEAANCFLKTLEEPAAGVIFILLSERSYVLLPTVVSRCQQVFFRYLSSSEVVEGLAKLAGLDKTGAELPAALSGGSLGQAMKLVAEGNLAKQRERVFTTATALTKASPGEACRLAQTFPGEREEMQIILDTLLLWYRDLLVWHEAGSEELVINRDFLPLLAQEAKNYTSSGIIDIIYMIEQAKNYLRANANPRLATEVLFLRLGRKGPAGI
jgi:DNA polymerase-3 subunit delta'